MGQGFEINFSQTIFYKNIFNIKICRYFQLCLFYYIMIFLINDDLHIL